FRFMPLAMVVIVPAIAMRLWSEELRGGTFETLMTFPVRVRHLVIGKWLAAWLPVRARLAAPVGLLVRPAPPVRVRHLRIGQCPRAGLVTGACLVATVGLVVTASSLGDVDMGPTIGGYLGS